MEGLVIRPATAQQAKMISKKYRPRLLILYCFQVRNEAGTKKGLQLQIELTEKLTSYARYLKPIYFSGTLILAIFLRQEFSVFLF